MIRSDDLAAARAIRYRRRPVLATLMSALHIKAQRAHLAQLDDHLLRDIGLTRPEAENESARPFWDVPAHWQR